MPVQRLHDTWQWQYWRWLEQLEAPRSSRISLSNVMQRLQRHLARVISTHNGSVHSARTDRAPTVLVSCYLLLEVDGLRSCQL